MNSIHIDALTYRYGRRRRLAASLAAGLLISIGIAWATPISRWIDLVSGRGPTIEPIIGCLVDSQGKWSGLVRESRWVSDSGLMARSRRTATAPRDLDNFKPTPDFRSAIDLRRLTGTTDDHLPDNIGASVETFGWPFRCVGFVFVLPDHSTNARRIGGTRLTWRGVSFSTLPYLPWWPGLLADAALWSIPPATLILAPPLLRRALRRRRNACEACGYSRAGITSDSPCPECGQRAARASERPPIVPPNNGGG